jgi:hypothetical protein
MLTYCGKHLFDSGLTNWLAVSFFIHTHGTLFWLTASQLYHYYTSISIPQLYIPPSIPAQESGAGGRKCVHGFEMSNTSQPSKLAAHWLGGELSAPAMSFHAG